MDFGCVYCCTYAPETSEYYVTQVVVFPCTVPCVDFTITTGSNAGTEFTSLSEECTDWPPSGSRAPTFETITSKDKGIIYRVTGYK